MDDAERVPNYVCLVGLEIELMREDPHPLSVQVAAWVGESGQHGEFDEMPFQTPAGLPELLSTEAEECPHERCPRYQECFAMAAARRAAEAPIVITNHALLGVHIASGGRTLPGAYETVIVEEARAFEDAATRAFGEEVSADSLRGLIYGEVGRYLADRDLLRAAQALLARLDMEVAGRVAQGEAVLGAPLSAGSGLADLLDNLALRLRPEKHIAAEPTALEILPPGLTEQPEPWSEAEAASLRLSKRAGSLAKRLRAISAVDNPDFVYYVEPDHVTGGTGGYTLLAPPLEVGPFLEAWGEQQATILTSATLTDGESFSFFGERLGLSGHRKLIVPSPFDYAKRTRLLLTPVPGQDRPDDAYYARLAGQIALLMDAAGGKCLLLFTSHRALESVWALPQVMKIAGWKLYRQGDAPQAQLVAALRGGASGDRIAMFASRSWWQGVDLPGMRLVVMDKLPFPQLGDPLVAARSREIERLEGQAFRRYVLPLALITFRQGFGRLMRCESDFGAVAVCDARLVTRQYAERFVEALPEGVPVLGSSDELRAWVRWMV